MFKKLFDTEFVSIEIIEGDTSYDELERSENIDEDSEETSISYKIALEEVFLKIDSKKSLKQIEPIFEFIRNNQFNDVKNEIFLLQIIFVLLLEYNNKSFDLDNLPNDDFILLKNIYFLLTENKEASINQAEQIIKNKK